MQIIIPSHGNTVKTLGKAKSSSGGYRFMTYVLEQRTEDGILLFHTLTREMLLLTEEEYAARYELTELREKWFVVPEALDDMEYADRVRFVRATVRKKPEHITNYTIFTTTDCNARCFYCYEMGRSRIPMSEETAHKAAKYIIDHCGDEKVKISWFGGEPLFNKKVIDLICGDLKDHGITYKCSMISNAYLFDDETVRRAVESWNLSNVQVTLDGTEAVYNKSKAFIYKDGESPYRIVLANIGRLLDAGIRVVIRMNMDRHNAEDLFLLADELHERFPDSDQLRAYSHVLFEYAGQTHRIREDEERRRLYENQRALQSKLTAYGMMVRHGIKRKLPVNMCMADSGSSRTILPNGELGLCEHYSEDNFIGHIDSDVIDQAMVQKFRETWEKTPACKTCACYPECIRLKMCSEEEECFAEMAEDRKAGTIDSMLYSWEMWKKKQEEAEDDRPGPC